MVMIIGMVISHLNSDILLMLFWSKVLGHKYSFKFTLCCTFVRCMLGCFLKIYSFLDVGLYSIYFTNVVTIVSFMIYLVMLFKSTLGKKILSFAIANIIFIFMDTLAMNITTIWFGGFEFMQIESNYTIVYILIANLLYVAGIWTCFLIWRKFETIEWKLMRYEYLCILLPISQGVLALYLVQQYSFKSLIFSLEVVLGILLAIVADIYMFVLFYRSNQRKKVEKELRQVEHQYEVEQLRYWELKNREEEVSKMRHDFQNYVLLMKNL